MTTGAAGRVLLGGKDAGSGFAITPGRALTAGHVVREATTMTGGRPDSAAAAPVLVLVCVVDRGEPAEVPPVVKYQPEDGEPIPVTRIEVSTSLDVAVLHLQHPAPAVLPAAGQAMAGAQWQVKTRPGHRDSYTLTGTVTDPHRRMWNEGGKETTLIQLLVEQDTGSYHGYSGSPVIAPSAGGTPGGVLGVLVEQGRWRTSAQLGQEPPVANVLFAAPIDQVLAGFDLAGVAVARSVRDLPLAVAFEVRRPEPLNQVIGALTGPSPDGELVGLAGMGGAGKSVLAAAAARDPTVAEAFPDGRFWLELGPHPPLLQLQASLAAALGDSTPITDVPQARARLSRLLGERRCLLVLDNVWDQADLSAFNVMGPSGRVLVTTRDVATVPSATIISLGEFSPDAAKRLLAGWTATQPGELLEEAAQVARECGYLPLALALCGAMIADGSHTWQQLLTLLRSADLDEVRSRLVDYPHPSLAVALAASIDTLPPDARDRYLQLAVFNGQGPVPAAALQVLWGLDQENTTALIEGLARQSLLRAEAGPVSLHDLQMDYLVRSAAASLSALHNQLLAAYSEHCPGGWATGPDDGYFYQHLAHHLHLAGRTPELQALLLNLDWMNAKLTTGTIPGLLADYDTLPSDPALRLVAGALRLSAHILADNPGQLPSQLTGRLASQTDPQLRDLLQRTYRWPVPWLRPLAASLIPPGGPLLRTMAGHEGLVRAVAISADGHRAISGGSDDRIHHGGSDDRTVRVWDLDTGTLLRTLVGHKSSVWTVAISADGHRAISGGEAEDTVRVWDLDTGTLLRTLAGHGGGAGAVAISADGHRAISGGDDSMVRVWDLDTGTLLHTLVGHGQLYAVAISADGHRAVCSGDDETVRVWDLDTETLLHTLAGHGGLLKVNPVAISADGRRAISGGGLDSTVRVWDLDTGTPLGTLGGDGGGVWAVAISADGRRAVAGCWDKTVRVWDLDTATSLGTLVGHDDAVMGVAISADGRRAVSGGDKTVRVWDLDAAALPSTLVGHDDLVMRVAICADGRRAVSGDQNGTVRVWDLGTGTLLHTMAGHDGPVWALAITADGRRAVSSGGEDEDTVRVWDLDTGALLHTLVGHHGPVWTLTRSADGRHVVSGGDDGTVRVWDLDTGTCLHLVAHHQDWVQAVAMAISADGRRAVSGGDDRMVRVWDLDTGTLLHTLAGHGGGVRTVAISADGRRAVSGGDDRMVRVWDLDTGTLLHILAGHPDWVHVVAISADGRHAVSGDRDGTVRVWDLAQGVELASFVSGNPITDVATTPPGKRVIAGTSTGPVHLLELCGYE